MNHIICFETENFAYLKYSFIGANVVVKMCFQGAEPIELYFRSTENIQQFIEKIESKNNKEILYLDNKDNK